jgi:HSP20 family molecular chaperone IbpA
MTGGNMQHKVVIPVLAVLLAGCAGFAGWQAWSIGQMRDQLTTLQQQVGNGNVGILPAPGQLQTQPLAPALPPVAGGNGSSIAPNGLFGNQIDPNDPFADFDRMQNEMLEQMQQLMAGAMPNGLFDNDLFDDDLFGGKKPGVGGGLNSPEPQLSMEEDKDSYVITIPIPEDSSAEVSASVQGGALNIEGKITVQNDSSNNKGTAFTSTQSRQFARSMPVPADANPDGMTNVTEDNQVIITIPKQA